MYPYLKALYEHLKRTPCAAEHKQGCKVFDYLTQCYIEDNPVSSDQIKSIENEMAPYYEEVSFEASERLFTMVYDLCSAYETAAFRDGFAAGFCFAEEMAGKALGQTN